MRQKHLNLKTGSFVVEILMLLADIIILAVMDRIGNLRFRLIISISLNIYSFVVAMLIFNKEWDARDYTG